MDTLGQLVKTILNGLHACLSANFAPHPTPIQCMPRGKKEFLRKFHAKYLVPLEYVSNRPTAYKLASQFLNNLSFSVYSTKNIQFLPSHPNFPLMEVTFHGLN